MSKSCKWFAGKTSKGYVVKCLVPGSNPGSKPKGTPRSWRIAWGPYGSRKKAVEVAMYQSLGRPPTFGRNKRRRRRR